MTDEVKKLTDEIQLVLANERSKELQGVLTDFLDWLCKHQGYSAGQATTAVARFLAVVAFASRPDGEAGKDWLETVLSVTKYHYDEALKRRG